ERARATGVGDPPAWTRALDAAQHADARAAGGWVSATLRQEVEELQRQVQEEHAEIERDRDLLARLEEIRTHKEDEFSHTDLDGDAARTFRRRGLEVDRWPGAAAQRIRARPAAVVAAVTAALDDWALERQRQQRPAAQWRRLLGVAGQADADRWRQELRAALS